MRAAIRQYRHTKVISYCELKPWCGREQSTDAQEVGSSCRDARLAGADPAGGSTTKCSRRSQVASIEREERILSRGQESLSSLYDDLSAGAWCASLWRRYPFETPATTHHGKRMCQPSWRSRPFAHQRLESSTPRGPHVWEHQNCLASSVHGGSVKS